MGSTGRRDGRLSPAAIAGWTGLAILLGGAFLAALGGLNQTLYGPSAFVERYLGNIARDDIVSAAATPGVRLDEGAIAARDLPADVSTALLRSGVVESGPEERMLVLYLPDQTVMALPTASGGWEVVDRDMHNLGVVPVVRMANRQRTADRVGKSEITPEVMSITDAACRPSRSRPTPARAFSFTIFTARSA